MTVVTGNLKKKHGFDTMVLLGCSSTVICFICSYYGFTTKPIVKPWLLQKKNMVNFHIYISRASRFVGLLLILRTEEKIKREQ